MRKILLSIKPCYAHDILAGIKTVEYRKAVPKKLQSGIAYIYSSFPEKKIVGEFKYKGILAMSPDRLWEETKGRGGIKEGFFNSYFSNKRIAYAFDIESIKKYEEPMKIESLGLKKAPQSWMYVED